MINKYELEYVASHLNFWSKLSEPEMNLLERNIAHVSYNKGLNLNSTNSECLGVLLVKSGGLRVYILSEDGREITLYRLGPNDVCVMSASCIISNITFDVHIDAESDTDAYLINITAFSKISAQNVYVENFTYKKSSLDVSFFFTDLKNLDNSNCHRLRSFFTLTKLKLNTLAFLQNFETTALNFAEMSKNILT